MPKAPLVSQQGEWLQGFSGGFWSSVTEGSWSLSEVSASGQNQKRQTTEPGACAKIET